MYLAKFMRDTPQSRLDSEIHDRQSVTLSNGANTGHSIQHEEDAENRK